MEAKPMSKSIFKIVSLVLVLCMVASFALTACNDDNTSSEASEVSELEAPKNYTYKSYSTSLGNNWNPHTWETNADDSILSYVSSPFCTMSILDSENGVYQWVYEMATEIKDVTKDHQDDLTKFDCELPEGAEASSITEGYVFEIKLNPDAKWENGEAINADNYIYSMKQLLEPKMKNYRSNLYWSGESAVAGGFKYYNALTKEIFVTTDLETAAALLAEGKDVYFDCFDFWGVDASYVDAEGNAAPQYVSFLDETVYGESVEDPFSGVEIWANYGPYFDGSYGLPYVKKANEDYNENYAEQYDEIVGCYKVDDYTIRYVNQYAIDYNYFLTSCTSTWLVYEPYYEAGKKTTGDLVTTDYGTKKENTMSYGTYKLDSYQADKQIVFVQNPEWYGFEKLENGGLVSYTNFEVDGQKVEQYKATKIVIDVMDDAAAKQAFLKGELTEWTPTSDDLPNYSASEQLYKIPETYTMSFFFCSGLDLLKEMDNSKGNTNSVVISNTDFRKAMSLAIDRADWVVATAGYVPAYSILNSLYFYDIYNDPESSYRNSEEAMQAIVNLYGVEYGEGKAYATLKDAYNSINGYNLTEAKDLMKKACDQLVADGLYKAGDEIHVRIGWMKGALDAEATKQCDLINQYVNAAAEGSGFGKITFEPVGSIEDRYGDVASGEYALGYGAWGGAAFYPFRNFQVYMDPDSYSIHEAGCWDPKTEQWTLKVNGEDETHTCQDWSNILIGTGKYANADFATKLSITAQLEEMYLKTYYRIPLASSTICSMLSYQASYYTENYNIMYDFGGLRLTNFNYDDEAWAAYVAEQGGTLSYE